MFCRKCGSKLKENARFCSKCGVSIDDSIEEKQQVIEIIEEKEEKVDSKAKKKRHKNIGRAKNSNISIFT